jgi:predicted kinase
MLVGLPASGKSTFVKAFLSSIERPDNWVILSTDNYIEEMASTFGVSYNEAWRMFYKPADKVLWNNLENALKEGKNVLWDQTNLRADGRAEKLAKFPKSYMKTAIVFPIPSDIHKRLASRPGKIIPISVWEDMKSTYTYPQKLEGWDQIIERKNNEC